MIVTATAAVDRVVYAVRVVEAKIAKLFVDTGRAVLGSHGRVVHYWDLDVESSVRLE